MAIEVVIHGKNMEVTDRLRDYVTRKIERLDRYLSGIDEARVELSHVKSVRSASDRQIAQLTVSGKGFVLRSEERADDIFAAFDEAVDKMQRRIERFKGKKRFRYRRDGRSAAMASMEAVAVPEDLEEEEAPIIARRKQFVLVPMNELEAIEQMQLLGHQNFFVFYNAETSSVNVLYLRRDGSYGLIETELG